MAAWLDPTAGRRDGRLFLSPHLDDAVLGCGEMIASSPKCTVATLFAGRPPAGRALTRWDADCGFRDGDDVIGARRAEDQGALDTLDARPLWLDFPDDQYGCSPPPSAIVGALQRLLSLEAAAIVFFPLGLFHADHRRTSDGALALIERRDPTRWYAYEDALYRRIAGAVEARVDDLRRRGFRLAREPLAVAAAAAARKRAAVDCYRSQLEGLATRAGHDDAFAAESYWLVERAR